MDPLLLGYVSLTAALVITPGATTAVVVILPATPGDAAVVTGTGDSLGCARSGAESGWLLPQDRDASGYLLGALGIGGVRPHVRRLDPPPDAVALFTDGLEDILTLARASELLGTPAGEMAAAVARLEDECEVLGHSDDATCVVAWRDA